MITTRREVDELKEPFSNAFHQFIRQWIMVVDNTRIGLVRRSSQAKAAESGKGGIEPGKAMAGKMAQNRLFARHTNCLDFKSHSPRHSFTGYSCELKSADNGYQ